VVVERHRFGQQTGGGVCDLEHGTEFIDGRFDPRLVASGSVARIRSW
jgi:hypothetical protein